MSPNQRVRQIRKHLKMNQSEFADHLGLSQAGVSWLEHEGNVISDQAIRILQLDFHVSKEWLMNGKGKMFFDCDASLMEALDRKYQISDMERKILDIYFSFDPSRRKMVCDFANDFFKKLAVPQKKTRKKASGE